MLSFGTRRHTFYSDNMRKTTTFYISEATPGLNVWQPFADIYKTRTGWMIKLDLAGVRVEDVRLSMQGNTLTVEGIRRDECIDEDCTYYLLEISYSRFRRAIS